DFLSQKAQFTVSYASFALGEDNLVRDKLVPAAPSDPRLAKHHFMLVVGSIEPHKNHVLLLQALKRLKADFGREAPLLVIAGADHQGSPAIDHWLCANPEIAERVIRIRNASDQEILWLYQNALFTLYPSLAEGWGLPVAESFQNGRVCLASNVSSVPEAARGFATLLDPYDPGAWADAIAARLRNPDVLRQEEKRIAEEWRSYSWQQSVGEVLQAVQTFPLRQPDCLNLPVNRLLELSNPENLQIVRDCFASGFHDFEPDGVWQSSLQAKLVVRTPPAGNVGSLCLRLRAFLAPNEAKRERTVTVTVNGTVAGILRVSDQPKTWYLPLPETAKSTWQMTITFDVDRVISPSAAGVSPDERALGIFVYGLGMFSKDVVPSTTQPVKHFKLKLPWLKRAGGRTASTAPVSD
ncbi:MAG: glycosyltransferase family 1 protein, partial [Candidatus Thiodiazotropha sp.]